MWRRWFPDGLLGVLLAYSEANFMVSAAQDNYRESDRRPNDYWTFAVEFEVRCAGLRLGVFSCSH